MNSIKSLFRLIKLVKPLLGYMILAITMGIIGHLCATFISVFAGYGLLNVLGESTFLSLATIFVVMAVMAIVRGAFRYGEQACNHFIAFKLLALIRDIVFKHLRQLAPAKLEGKDKGNLISIITSDIELLEVFYAHTISPTAIALVFSMLLVWFIGSFHVILGIIAFGAYVMVGIIVPIILFKLNSHASQYRQRSGQLNGFVLDSVKGLSQTIQYHGQASRLEQLNQQSRLLNQDALKMNNNMGFNRVVTHLVIWLFDLMMLWVSLQLYQAQQLNFEALVVVNLALMGSFGPTVALANLGSMLQTTTAAANRVMALLDEVPLVSDVINQQVGDYGDIVINDVSFKYLDEEVLDNVSLTFKQDQIIGLIGKSGSGKSTLLKLVMRFFETQHGDIKINDNHLNQINTDSLRNLQGYVTQETFLFRDSILNNLKIAKQDASMEEIIRACQKAAIHDFIMALPEGYDTILDENGESVSGGQRQRLGLARAFLHQSPIVLLDEPTSNLDSLNEAIILKSLAASKSKKLIVLVTHRQSTLSVADDVFKLEQGRVNS